MIIIGSQIRRHSLGKVTIQAKVVLYFQLTVPLATFILSAGKIEDLRKSPFFFFPLTKFIGFLLCSPQCAECFIDANIEFSGQFYAVGSVSVPTSQRRQMRNLPQASKKRTRVGTQALTHCVVEFCTRAERLALSVLYLGFFFFFLKV